MTQHRLIDVISFISDLGWSKPGKEKCDFPRMRLPWVSSKMKTGFSQASITWAGRDVPVGLQGVHQGHGALLQTMLPEVGASSRIWGNTGKMQGQHGRDYSPRPDITSARAPAYLCTAPWRRWGLLTSDFSCLQCLYARWCSHIADSCYRRFTPIPWPWRASHDPWV